MSVCSRTKFHVSSIILMSFRYGIVLSPPSSKRIPKKPTEIRVNGSRMTGKKNLPRCLRYNEMNLILEKRIFPDNLKTVRVTPAFIGGDRSELRNFKLMSVLTCSLKYFSVLCIIAFTNTSQKKIFFSKQFDFQVFQPTGNAIIQLVDQIFEAFKNNLCTLGMFIDV